MKLINFFILLLEGTTFPGPTLWDLQCNDGKKQLVVSRIREKAPSVFDFGCVCHLANLCAVAGVKALALPMQDLLVEIYFHFYLRYVHVS